MNGPDSRVKAVLFDVGWTLLHPRQSLREIFADLVREAEVVVDAGEIEAIVHGYVRALRGRAIEGIKKPDRRIFEPAVEGGGTGAEEMVHVGDMYVEDVLGARGAGIRPLLMERGRKGMFPGHPESEGVADGCCEVVRNLDDVARAIGLA